MGVVEDVVALELRLLDPAVRRQPREVKALLHPDFTEVGVSGRIWDRQSIVAALADDPGMGSEVADISGRVVATDVVLVTYQAGRADDASTRASIWVKDAGSWKVLFHIGVRGLHHPVALQRVDGDHRRVPAPLEGGGR